MWLHKQMCLSAHFCAAMCSAAEHILPLLFWPSVGRRMCESWSPGALWQAEAESSALLSRTVQDKGPLPPVWG